jgi:DeoR/GlpR family transcriptional regulator of sugar metabolism
MSDKEMAVLDYIDLHQFAAVEELSSQLKISLSTVRRILDRLEQRNRVVRYHGGATIVNDHQRQTALSTRYDANRNEKESIARAAAGMIEPGSTIILLGGTTVFYLCRYLRQRRLRIITNSLIVLDALKNDSMLEMILLGGVYNPDESEVRGSLTNSALQMLGADYLFSGATAFDPGRGFLTSHIDSVELYSRCFEAAKKVIVLADSTKYGKMGLAVVAKVEDVDCLITDRRLPLEAIQAFTNKGLEVVLADESQICGMK